MPSIDERRRDDRQPITHGEIDLALHAGAVAQRRNRDAAAGEVRLDVGDVTEQDEIVGRERA